MAMGRGKRARIPREMRIITKARNRKSIMIYYAVAIIFASIGLYTKQLSWYIYAAVILGLALIRKYWLMRRLKE